MDTANILSMPSYVFLDYARLWTKIHFEIITNKRNLTVSGKKIAPVTISFCLCITFLVLSFQNITSTAARPHGFHFNNQVHTDFLNCWMKTFAHIYSGKWVVFCWHTRGHQLLLWTWDSGNAEANDPQIPTPSAQALQPGILESLTGFPPVASCIKVNKSATSQRNPWSWHAFHFHCEVYFKKDMWMTMSKCITLFRVVLNRCYINNP